ncbi:valine--tRNA ligase [Ochrobactrum sp. AN78]|uniref:valine--tRNA ligase n=1 Tax=Ochrobactrum sp. AN78 TaxID=3039853 RepID=UPI002989D8B4|nr:valine--tRNA ligase [Ochrobactrum sp. AN78]MDH7793229.1 valyl-tRNA synthetase [Ochrobactrum sp. AN78]
MLEKTYDAAAVEPKIAERWEEAGAFKAGAGSKPGADPFAVVIPPPNVTGSLHMGHALNNTIQDIMVRFERMRGKNVLWQPGLDHAGIATQMVVERQLAERQEPTRHIMGREKFIERIWQWKSESGGMISNQLRRLGASCDWSRERFTMDEGLSRAVLEVFVSLYKQGLMYRDKRLVNWDPKLLTAISDIEVESREIKGNLWHLRYPLENIPFDPENPHTFIVVATTRPETMLGDTGVAVNPKDERYHASVGNNIVLPLVGRRIPIVADDYADPEAGSGAVKITPAHDFNDFEVGKRNDLRAINILTPSAAITLKDNVDFLEGLELTPDLIALIKEFEGLDRFAARKRLVEMLDEQGYLEKIEDHTHAVPHGDRGGVPIEPYLTDQWYVNAAQLAKPAMAAVRDGRTQIVPKNWEKTYFDWMENIQPWCVSRQLWWGHQIPAWYGPDGHCFVEKSEEEAKAAAHAHYGEEVALERDTDVLDTWFSSGLWPFSTLGWPDKTPELGIYYPTSVLVTGFDILFFWVARMMMMGMHFMEEIPFHTVYLHALVRDKHGAKMSKSKGNVIDPLELMDEYGADALRFTLAIMAAQGRDVKLDPARIAGYRNFGTKLWNATRFAQMNGVKLDPNFKPDDAKLAVNRWILTELTKAARAVTEGIANYRFNEAASAAYRFVWNQFCDWYLELLKPIFMGDDELAKAEAQATAAYCLDEIYKILHPFMPFMTEELWTLTAGEGAKRDTVLALAQWPELSFEDEESAADINWLVDLVMGIRSVRAEMNVPAGAVAPIVVLEANAATIDRFARHDAAIKRLARVESVSFEEEASKGSAQLVHGEATICLPLGSLIDLKAEAARMAKEAGKIAAEMEKIEKKLSNEKFVANAKEEVVQAERERLAELKDAAARVATAEARIREAG